MENYCDEPYDFPRLLPGGFPSQDVRRGNPGRAQWLLRWGDRADGLRRQGGWGPLGRIPERGELHGAIREIGRAHV